MQGPKQLYFVILSMSSEINDVSKFFASKEYKWQRRKMVFWSSFSKFPCLILGTEFKKSSLLALIAAVILVGHELFRNKRYQKNNMWV